MRGDEFFVEVAKAPPFNKLHPKVAAFFKSYFAEEKIVRFGDQRVVNTHFPPYPSRAFDNLANGFAAIGHADGKRLYSVTLAVTNRCMFQCWHCYNAGRDQRDMPLAALRQLAGDLQARGAVMVTLTGGEPLLRRDLAEIARAFDDRSCLIVGSTGWGLTAERARELRDSGVFGLAISLDSRVEQEHDRLRGRPGAFRAALDAIAAAQACGLYPYVVSVATREFLAPEHFWPFMRLAADSGALEVHLLEPSATGRLAGCQEVLLAPAERQTILDYQRRVANDERLPILSSYTYLEGEHAFGCGAGLTHLYIDGGGEVCPCQLVPLSFGNIAREPIGAILDRLGRVFQQPRTECIGRTVAPHIPPGASPANCEVSAAVCRQCLPAAHELPRFFRVRADATEEVGTEELREAYDDVHADYDDHWLSEARHPIHDLVRRLDGCRYTRVFEAGCGTGYATALLARLSDRVVAADISAGMLGTARNRIARAAIGNVDFRQGDALQLLGGEGPFDLVFTSWVLGYIPLAPFFAAASVGLAPRGKLALVVHKENTPREALEIFAELVAREPESLRKQVAFDFPRDAAHLTRELRAAGLAPREVWEGSVVFRCPTPEAVLEHLLKSGAGTAFHAAIDPARRDVLTGEFLERLRARRGARLHFEVAHDYVACIAEK